MKALATDYGIQDDIAHGRVPVISWNCADDIQTPALSLGQITSGAADSDLALIRTQLLSLHYPNGGLYPVVLRYFWEFNINATQPGNMSNGNGGCFGGNNATLYPTQFISARQHIHNALSIGAPVPNITWDWNPSVQDVDPVAYEFPGPVVDPSPYYPTNAYVDWIGVDGYSKQVDPSNVQSPPKTFDQIFGGWYSEFNTYGKPMMIGETGSCEYYDQNRGYVPDQIAYLGSIQSALESTYPLIKAVDYFDAPGSYVIGADPGRKCIWSLTNQVYPEDSTSGVAELTSIANDPFFLNFVSNP